MHAGAAPGGVEGARRAKRDISATDGGAPPRMRRTAPFPDAGSGTCVQRRPPGRAFFLSAEPKRNSGSDEEVDRDARDVRQKRVVSNDQADGPVAGDQVIEVEA